MKKYAISFMRKLLDDAECHLYDTIDAFSVVEAYQAANDIADKLNAICDREDAFVITSIEVSRANS